MDQRIRDSFARQSLMATFGAALVEIAPGRVTLAQGPQVTAGQALHQFLDLVLAQVAAQQGDTFALLAGFERIDAGGGHQRQDKEFHFWGLGFGGNRQV